jgi:hypothetical protein
MSISLAFDFAHGTAKEVGHSGSKGRLLVAFSIYLRNALAIRIRLFRLLRHQRRLRTLTGRTNYHPEI